MNFNVCPHCGHDYYADGDCERIECLRARGIKPPQVSLFAPKDSETEVFVQGDCLLRMGCSTVELDKEFGPTIFAQLRVTASLERGGWVVERWMPATDSWKEYALIPAQLDEDFTEIYTK